MFKCGRIIDYCIDIRVPVFKAGADKCSETSISAHVFFFGRSFDFLIDKPEFIDMTFKLFNTSDERASPNCKS